VGVAGFAAQNRRLKPFATQQPIVRQTTLSPPERLPRLVLLGVLPPLLLAGAAIYLYSHWDGIPAHLPLYLSGENGDETRTGRRVYRPLILGVEISAWLYPMEAATWYGSRRTELMRRPMLAFYLHRSALWRLPSEA
jgi:hypothetical protein